MQDDKSFDYLIIGAGIIGLTIAYELNSRYPDKKILIIEKESDVAQHASGLNSGVLHAGFYYSSDSLKAKFCRDGNALMKSYCKANDIPLNECGKVVVAKDQDDLEGLKRLYDQGKKNGIRLEMIDETQLNDMDPKINTFQQALYSPDTASVDPVFVCQSLKQKLIENGTTFYFNTQFVSQTNNGIYTQSEFIPVNYVINASGLYTDQIAKAYGFGSAYTLIPFKGNYIKYDGETDLKYHIYPVPDLKMPFLGVHYTQTVQNKSKIGPSSIPGLWREHYTGMTRFKLNEFIPTLYYLLKMTIKNQNNVQRLMVEEIKKLFRQHFIKQIEHMTDSIDLTHFTQRIKPGIRAQLIEKNSTKLVMDFIIEGDENSIHILNTISPAFTCSFSLAKYTVDRIANYQNIN